MNWRFLLLTSTVSVLLPIGRVVAIAQTGSQATSPANNAPPLNFVAQMPLFPPPPPPPGMGGESPEPPWAKGLNLTAEQKQRIKTIHEQAKPEIEGMRQQLMEADKQMRSLLESNTSTEELRKQHQKIQSLRQQLDNKHFEMMLTEREVLTPQQRNQLNQLMQQQRPIRPMPQ